jgi:hypothetical protein
MATAVQIEITLDDSGMVTGAQRVNSALGSMGKAAEQTQQPVNAVFDGMLKHLDAIEKNTASLGNHAQQHWDKVAKAELKANEAARLITEELGVNVPRAVTKVISAIPGLSTALNAGFKALAIAGFVAAIGEAIINIDMLKKKAQDIGLAIYSIFDKSTRDMQRGLAVDRELDSINQKLLAVKSTADLAGKQGFAAITQQLVNANKELDQFQDVFERETKEKYGTGEDTTNAILGAEQQKVADMRVQLEHAANAQILALRRQHAQEILQAETAAEVIGKSQIEAIHIQLAASLKQIDARRDVDQRERLALEKAAEEKATNEEAQVRREAMVAGLQALRQAQADGADGEERIRLELQTKLAAITQQEIKDGFELSDQRQAAELEADTAIRRLREQSAERVRVVEDEAAVASALPWERTADEIVLHRDEALKQIQRQLAHSQITEEDAARETAAIWKKSNAEMVDDMASKFQSFFDDLTSGNLGKRLLKNFETLVFRMVATWIAGVQQMQSASGGGQGGGGGGGFFGAIGSIFRGVLGLPVPGGTTKGGVPGISGLFGNSFAGGGAGGGFGSIGGFGGFGFPALGFDTGSGSGVSVSAAGGGAASSGSISRPSGGGPIGIGSAVAAGGRFAGIAGLGALGAGLLGGKLGGTATQIGATIGVLGTAALYGAFGAQGTLAAAPFAPFLGPAVGGLVGFGIGEQHGPIAGSLSGAGSGALVGFLAAGPVGALIGGIVGALGGIFGGLLGGSKRRHQAEAYGSQVLPAIQKIEDAYKAHGLGYQSALDQLTKLETDAQTSLGTLKGEGSDEFRKIIMPAITNASTDIAGIETIRGQRGGLLFGLPQFAGGVASFNPLMSPIRVGADGGVAVLHRDERVLTAQENRNYSRGGGDVYQISAIDAKSFEGWLKTGGGIEAIANAVQQGRRGGKKF